MRNPVPPARPRLRALGFVLAGLLAGMSGATGFAQTFPSKAVRIIVPFSAGGGVDTVARLIGTHLGAMWNQPVIVENRPGASGVIGTDVVAKAAPDGYTVLMGGNNSLSLGPYLMKVPYDPVRDFTPITLAVELPNVLVVGQSVPAKNMGELAALAKAKPGTLSFASSGIGSMQQLAGEMFNLATGAKAVHVAYKGSAESLVDVMSGTVTMSFDTATGTMPHIQSGKLHALAVTSAHRIAALPDVPTAAEAGFPSIEVTTWYALFGPGGLPKALADKWQRDVATVLKMPEVKSRIEKLGGDAVGGTPEQLRTYFEDDRVRMGTLLKQVGIKND